MLCLVSWQWSLKGYLIITLTLFAHKYLSSGMVAKMFVWFICLCCLLNLVVFKLSTSLFILLMSLLSLVKFSELQRIIGGLIFVWSISFWNKSPSTVTSITLISGVANREINNTQYTNQNHKWYTTSNKPHG